MNMHPRTCTKSTPRRRTSSSTASRSTPSKARPSSKAAKRQRRRAFRTFATRTACAPTATAAPACVEIEGRAHAWRRACCRNATAGMEVPATSERARQEPEDGARRCCSPTCPTPATVERRRLRTRPITAASAAWRTERLGCRMRACAVRPELKRALRARAGPAADLSHPAMAVNLDACIQCNRCVRACREEQVNDVIGYALRGAHSEIVFDLADPMGDSDLRGLRRMRAGLPDRRADAQDARSARQARGQQGAIRSARSAACGCLLTYNVKDNAHRAAWTAATARPTTAACASKAALASTTPPARSA